MVSHQMIRLSGDVGLGLANWPSSPSTAYILINSTLITGLCGLRTLPTLLTKLDFCFDLRPYGEVNNHSFPKDLFYFNTSMCHQRKIIFLSPAKLNCQSWRETNQSSKWLLNKSNKTVWVADWFFLVKMTLSSIAIFSCVKKVKSDFFIVLV